MLNVDLEFIVEKKGKILFRQLGPSHTFVRNWFNILFCALAGSQSSGSSFGEGYLNIKRQDGTVIAATYNNTNHYDAGSGVTDYGIVLGRGTTAESFESYSLATKITHGSGTNQLVYNAQSLPSVSYTSGTKTWLATHQRVFNNNSSAAITVTESALISYYGSYYILISRDLLSSSVNVPVGAQLTAKYYISMQFPA